MAEDESRDPTTRERWEFTPEQLDRTVLAIPLLNDLTAEKEGLKEPETHAVVMEVNLEHRESRDATRDAAIALIRDAIKSANRPGETIKPTTGRQYLYARLWGDTIREIVARNEDLDRPIYRIWPDFPIRTL
jgi:hypothetical protein